MHKISDSKIETRMNNKNMKITYSKTRSDNIMKITTLKK